MAKPTPKKSKQQQNKAQPQPAGDFIRWANEISPPSSESKIHTAETSANYPNTPNVPCGSCNACCKSSYFIHINKSERDTLKHIPKALLFPAPGQVNGNMLMGFDESGKCPMLVEEKCSIYLHRPQTCREYDCRIFAAAGINAGSSEKKHVNEQVKQWVFDHQQQDKASLASELHTAIQRAAEFLQTNGDKFEQKLTNPTQIALLAISLSELFSTQQNLSEDEILSHIQEKLKR